MPSDADDLKIVEDQSIETRKAKQSILNSRVAVSLGAAVIGVYALLGATVMATAFFENRDIPTWATAIESSTITAALAIIFKDHLPETGKGRRRK